MSTLQPPMAALDAALDVWDDVDMTVLRKKSLSLCKTFIDLVEQRPVCRRSGGL